MNYIKYSKRIFLTALGSAALAFSSFSGMANAWEPSKPIDFIIMAGKGGGADKMARLMQAIVEKESLGGVCLNRGCIPSKTLLHIAKVLEETESLKKQYVQMCIDYAGREYNEKKNTYNRGGRLYWITFV